MTEKLPIKYMTAHTSAKGNDWNLYVSHYFYAKNGIRRVFQSSAAG